MQDYDVQLLKQVIGLKMMSIVLESFVFLKLLSLGFALTEVTPNMVTKASACSPRDLLIVGCGTLGSLAAQVLSWYSLD
jgi:threonine dehydrogenase-like Zn-dependent dehydrogenase